MFVVLDTQVNTSGWYSCNYRVNALSLHCRAHEVFLKRPGLIWFSLVVIMEDMSQLTHRGWLSLLYPPRLMPVAGPACIRRILPCFWSKRRAFGKQECAGSFPASSQPSHAEEPPSRVSIWTCGRWCSCSSSSASAPGMKVRTEKRPPPFTSLTVWTPLGDQRDQISEQFILRLVKKKRFWMSLVWGWI